MNRNTLKVAAAYALVYLVWGSTFFFIKMAVESISPAVVVGVRWTLGGALCLACAALAGERAVPAPRAVLSAAVLGVLLILVPNGLVTVVERTVDSYLVALTAVLTPVGVAVSDRVFLGRRVSSVTLACMAAGIAGVLVLLSGGMRGSALLGPEAAMLVVAFVTISVGTSMGQRLTLQGSVLANTGMQMLTSGAVCLIAAGMFAPEQFAAARHASIRSLAALAYLIVLGSAAFGAYNYLLRHEPAVRITSYAMVNPVIAVLLGMLLGNEAPVQGLALGLPFVLAGLGTMFYGETLIAALKRRVRRFAYLTT